jgi:hypothetical protein
MLYCSAQLGKPNFYGHAISMAVRPLVRRQPHFQSASLNKVKHQGNSKNDEGLLKIDVNNKLFRRYCFSWKQKV